MLVAVLLGLSGSVQAGGPRYDDYYYGGGYYGGYYPNYPPRPPLPPRPSSSSADPAAALVRATSLRMGVYFPSASSELRSIPLLGWGPLSDARYSPPYVGPRW